MMGGGYVSSMSVTDFNCIMLLLTYHIDISHTFFPIMMDIIFVDRNPSNCTLVVSFVDFT